MQLEQDLVSSPDGKLTAVMVGLVWLISGATSGIGRATAIEFTQEGLLMACEELTGAHFTERRGA